MSADSEREMIGLADTIAFHQHWWESGARTADEARDAIYDASGMHHITSGRQDK